MHSLRKIPALALTVGLLTFPVVALTANVRSKTPPIDPGVRPHRPRLTAVRIHRKI